MLDAGGPGFSVSGVEFTAPAGSGEPNLDATPDGRVVMSWFEKTGDKRHALRVAMRSDGAWSEPRTIVEGGDFFVNWADFPSILELPDGSWVAHWLQKTAASTYAYHVQIAISQDKGATWSKPVTPHRDLSPTEHGFVSMVPWRDGVGLIWLDGRA
ncbi:MAG: exo-alpha-sialidase, partial [Gemmatimonadetes bacterium]|nr:exo-alpha-sialidase [Gemmatimonadota bacterium]